MSGFACQLVLFDLDGTLVDTAPDLFDAANVLRARRGLEPMPFASFRALVSRGGIAMLSHAFPDADATTVSELLPEFLTRYGESVAQHSALFPEMEGVLVSLEEAGLRWGVVTNKPEGLARQLLQQMGLERRCAVLIGGDTVGARKPDPAPLLEACRRMQVAPESAVYIGDDPRDIDAAKAAGMPNIGAAWGYLDSPSDAQQWQADAVAASPEELLQAAPFGLDHG